MRARRPERFSDSVGNDIPILDRSQLEYHLSSLTSRSEELAFETFARRLLEHTVCPNLLPHTGPTGGGDSKVDTETYPVAEALAMAWFIGNGNEAATERWGFAFSAKAKWKPKLKDDIAKIVATQRGYTKAFFVSSQFISDRARSAEEDALRKKYGIDVRIFDRSWILDKVFGEGLEQLAIDELKIAITIRHEIRKGPLDTEREQDLQDIEERIAAAIQEGRRTSVLVEDCIAAAELARNLERPRTEVDGFYLRATRLAKQFGTPHQLLESTYEHAWASFWWYEDYSQFIELYGKVERLAKGSENVHELELWSNLHSGLYIAVGNGHLDAKTVNISARTAALAAELNRLAQEPERPSAALQARTLHLLLKLLVEFHKDRQTAIDRVLRELSSIVRESAPLIGYPLDTLVKILTEMGDVLGDRETYENLFETIVQVTAQREGELTAGHMLLKRGAQQMDAEQWYEGIRTLGRALGKLYKYESRSEEIRALYLCARAYEKVGLLWAARGTMLAAASIATNEFLAHDRVTSSQAACYKQLKWIELQLGRIPHVLAWHQLDYSVRAMLAEKGYDAESLFEEDVIFDGSTGILLLHADLPTLGELVSLPDALDGLGLIHSATALKYALGHENEVSSELLGGPENPHPHIEVFRQWRDQPVADILPPAPLLYTEQEIALHSVILGCRISVHTQNQSPCIEIAESLIAALESLLATGASEGAAAMEPKLTINIKQSDFAPMPFGYHIEFLDGLPHVEIGCPQFSSYNFSAEGQASIKNALFDVIVGIAARVFLIEDIEKFFTKLFRDDLAIQRALDFTTSFVIADNILGQKSITTLEYWTENHPTYPLKRTEVWDEEDRRQFAEKIEDYTPKFAEKIEDYTPKFAEHSADTPPKLLNQNIPSHRHMATLSLIRESLWEQAGWIGTGFEPTPAKGGPPLIGLLFNNGDIAKKIFDFWRAELGERDDNNKLRLSIIRGISRTHPYWYRVVVGSNITGDLAKQKMTRFLSVSRPCTMTPSTGTHLSSFLASYRVHGSYVLNYGFSYQGHMVMPPVNQLLKKELIVRQAWEIGRHDLDSAGIREEDDPIIPESEPDAPIFSLLNWRRSRH
jgi:hypothetical protein